ncbi:MAG: hypothetical protein AB7T49_11285 [Oligoflexales bacterium]
MDIDWPYYIIIFLFSGVGYVFFSYGKKMALVWHIVAGISLMAYGYFCHTWQQALVAGIVLTSLPFIGRFV